MRRILVAAALGLAMLMPSHALAANTWGTDVSDLWWNPNESGWGANIAHQGDIVFVTLFVYGADSKVKWYVGPSTQSQGGSSAYVFSGLLYQTEGPFLGGAFNPAAVGTRQVGTVAVDFASVTQGTLTYSVDGVNVVKAVQRQTWRSNDLSGFYIGAVIGSNRDCAATSEIFETATNFYVHQTGSDIYIAASNNVGVGCNYFGTYAQSGRMGVIAGNVECTSGLTGTFQATEVEAGYGGFLARYTSTFAGGCSETGRFGGVKRQ